MTAMLYVKTNPGGQSATLTFSYSMAVVEAFKRTVVGRERRWDANSKCWSLTAAGVSQLSKIVDLIDAVIFVDGVERYRSNVAKTTGSSDAYAVLHLLPSAPTEVVQAAYRALSKLHHPDLGGDLAKMQSINEAYRRILQ